MSDGRVRQTCTRCTKSRTVYAASTTDPVPIVVEPVPIAPPASELTFIKQAKPAWLLGADGPDIVGKIDPVTGLFPSTLVDGWLEIEGQRRAADVVCAGLVLNDINMASLGLKAFEAGFDPVLAGPLGNWPNERGGTTEKQSSLHAKSEFIEAAAYSMLLLREAGQHTARVDALLPALLKSARWMAGSSDLTRFIARAENFNQLFFVSSALHLAGVATGDVPLQAKAENIVRTNILPRQWVDGTFPEKRGFDSSYQTVSLELLGHYVVHLPAGPWRTTCMDALRLGTTKFLSVVRPDGTIYTANNTRTIPDGEPKRPGELIPKGAEIDRIPFRMYYMGYLLDDAARLNDIGDAILKVGQGFSHDE